MRCDGETLSALMDGELHGDEAREVSAHIQTCAACEEEMRMFESTRKIAQSLPRYAAPDVLRARVRNSISSAGARGLSNTSPLRRGSWWRLAAAAVVVAAMSSAATVGFMKRDRSGSLASQVAMSHVQSLMAGHLLDVVSTDQHNVKPWFAGRVNLSPPVPRLDSADFALMGGRVDHVDGKQVAVVVYKRRLHLIDVYSWPTDEGATAARVATVNGYHLVQWRSEGLEHWAVSDLNLEELRTLQSIYR